MYKIFNFLKRFFFKDYKKKINLSSTIDQLNLFFFYIRLKIQNNKLRNLFIKIKEYRMKIFNIIMLNFVFRAFKNIIFLKFFVLFIILSLFLLIVILYGFNFSVLKIYFLILLLTRSLFIKFEQIKELQNLNLIFLYLNLVFFLVFFFNDLEFVYFELKGNCLKLFKKFYAF